VSRFLEDLFTSALKKKSKNNYYDEWIEKTAGIYKTGSKDILNEILKGIRK